MIVERLVGFADNLTEFNKQVPGWEQKLLVIIVASDREKEEATINPVV